MSKERVRVLSFTRSYVDTSKCGKLPPAILCTIAATIAIHDPHHVAVSVFIKGSSAVQTALGVYEGTCCTSS